MQTRSSRGVQQHQVDGAADELLAQGQRPTIEKVRLHLGHGSPNTIAPMLEIWFAGLGKRVRGLAGTQGWGDQLPDWLLQAAEALWTKAQSEASAQADTALQAERQTLTQREAELNEQTQALAQREAVMQARLHAQEQALGEARALNSTLQQRLEQAELEAQGQHKHLLGLQEDLRLVRERRHADEDRHQAELKALNDDRRKTEERADSAAARAAMEIDRARQEAKAERATRQRLEKLLEEQREAHQTALTQTQQQAVELQQGLGVANAQLKLAQELLAQQQSELQQLREQWAAASLKTAKPGTEPHGNPVKPAPKEAKRPLLRSAARPGGGGVRVRRRP